MVPAILVVDPLVSAALLLGGVLGWLLLLRPAAAVALYVALSPFERYVEVFISPQASKLAGLLVFAGYALRLLLRVERRPARHVGLAAVAALLLVAVASTTLSPNGAEGLATLVRYLSFGLLCAVIVSLARHGRVLERLLQVYVAATTGAALAGLWNFAVVGVPRATGPLDDPNDLAFFLAVGVPLAVALHARDNSRRRLPWLACAAVLVTGTAFTLSRGAGLALAVLVAWALLHRLVRAWVVTVAAAAAFLLIGGVAVAAPEVVSRALQEKGYIADRNVDTRQLRWDAAARMAVDAPLLGQGPSGFRTEYENYARAADVDETDVVAHEMYLEVAAEFGGLGLAALLCLLAVAWRAAGRARRPDGQGPAGDELLAAGVQGGLLVVLVAALFLTEQYYLPLWLLAGAAMALELRRDAPGQP